MEVSRDSWNGGINRGTFWDAKLFLNLSGNFRVIYMYLTPDVAPAVKNMQGMHKGLDLLSFGRSLGQEWEYSGQNLEHTSTQNICTASEPHPWALPSPGFNP